MLTVSIKVALKMFLNKQRNKLRSVILFLVTNSWIVFKWNIEVLYKNIIELIFWHLKWLRLCNETSVAAIFFVIMCTKKMSISDIKDKCCQSELWAVYVAAYYPVGPSLYLYALISSWLFLFYFVLFFRILLSCLDCKSAQYKWYG